MLGKMDNIYLQILEVSGYIVHITSYIFNIHDIYTMK